jgi:uncharacterized protein (TIGR03435 family)
MIRAATLLAFVGTLAAVPAQISGQQPMPTFEVASVRPNKDATSLTVGISGDSMRLTGVTARNLIVRAYGVQPFEIIGGPDWLSARRFDVVAKAPAGASVAQMNLMLRPLLAERFKLVARVEQRESPVFFLVTAREDGKLGPALQPAANADCGRREATAARSPEHCRMLIGIGVLDGTGQPLYSLTTALEKIVGRPVVDMTYLTGPYDFTLTYASDVAPPNAADGKPESSAAASVFTALQEQLGLRLERQRGPVEVVVIDSIQPPTAD